MAGRYTTVTATLYLSDGVTPAANETVTQTLQSPLITGSSSKILSYYVSGDSNNGEVLLTTPRDVPTDGSGVLTMHLTAPLDIVATDYTGNVAANAYYLIELPDGRIIKTTTFAYSASPITLGSINSDTGATGYLTAPVTFDVDTSDEVGAPITVSAHLSIDGEINSVMIAARTAYTTTLDASGHGTLNLPPNANSGSGQAITPANTFWWVTLSSSPNVAYPIVFDEHGGAFLALLANPLPQGELGAWVAGTQRGVWSSGANYNINDLVTSGGSTFYAKVPNINVMPVAGATWGVLAAGGTGPTGPAGATGAAGAAGTNGVPTSIVPYATLTAYAAGSGVTSAGQTFLALVNVPSSNTTAPVNGATWRLLAAAGAAGATGPAGPTGAAGSGTTLAIAGNGTVAGTRPELNVIPGAGIGVTAADNSGAARVDLTLAVTDATTNATGGVQIDHATVGTHPTAIALNRLNAPLGPAQLGADGTMPSMALPGTAGSMAEAGRWVRKGQIIFAGGTGWKQVAVAEPSVLFDGQTWHMWFSGQPAAGEFSTAIGYASCPGTADHTVAANWTEYASNPVIAACALEPDVIRLADGSYRMYYSDHYNLLAASSTDRVTWTLLGTCIATGTASNTWWNHSAVWQEEDGTWHMIANGGDTASTHFQNYHLTSPSGLPGSWTMDSYGVLASLAPGGISGRPSLPLPYKRNGRYQLWLHASTSGVAADLYRASSPDLHNWTFTGSGPILTHLGTGIEAVQIADPSVLEVYGKSSMFYDGDTGSTAGICLATFDGTLAQLVDGTPLGAGGAVSVTDGSTTVATTTEISFSGVTVTDLGGGIAGVAITGGGGGGGELLMQDGVTFPPVPLTTEDGSDWIYSG